MPHPSFQNIGAFIHAHITLPPLANAAGTRNGIAVDRLQPGGLAASVLLVRSTGATTGTPSATTLDVRLQSSADGSTGWVDVASGALPQKTTLTAAIGELDIDLSSAQRYLRAVEVNAFTGGTSPATPSGVDIILGGFSKLPA